MKRLPFRFFCLIGLFLVACTTGLATNETPVPTATEATATSQPEVMLTPTTIPIPATATAVAIPIASATLTLLSTDTPAPTATTTNLPPPTGFIAYVSPVRPGTESTYNDVLAIIPGATAYDWEVKPILNHLLYAFLFPSPDGQRLAIAQYSDTNGNGFVQPSDDSLDYYLYIPASNSFTQLTYNEYYPPLGEIQWAADNQSFFYPVLNDVFGLDVMSGDRQLLYSFPERVFQLALSPDGETLAVFINKVEESITLADAGQLVIYELQTGQFTVLLEKINEGKLLWSPDSQWLAFVEDGRLTLIAPQTKEQIVIFVSERQYDVTAVWSPDSQWLAYIRDYDTLVTWNSQTGESREFYRGEFFQADENDRWGALKDITWLPDSQSLLLTLFDHDKAKFVFIELENGMAYDFLTIDRVDYHTREENLQYLPELISLGWSPDSNWLLFFAEWNGVVGLYIVYKDGSEPHLIYETGVLSPKATWLSVAPNLP